MSDAALVAPCVTLLLSPVQILRELPSMIIRFVLETSIMNRRAWRRFVGKFVKPTKVEHAESISVLCHQSVVLMI